MNYANIKEKKIKKILLSIICFVVAMYLGQAIVLHFRLKMVAAEKISLNSFSEICDDLNCNATWSIQTKHRFLLLGHIMRTHKVYESESNEQIFPISKIRGVEIDSWNGLRVYAVKPATTYILKATKPRAVKMNYFIGILPRSSDHEGMLSIPDISPTIATISTVISFGLLGILLFAASLAPISGMDAEKKRMQLHIIMQSAMAAFLASMVGSGAIDSLIPDGEMRSRILRTAVVSSMALLPLNELFHRFLKRNFYANFLSILSIILIVNLNWSILRAGVSWVVMLSMVNLWSVGFLYLRVNTKIGAILALTGFYDPITMMGWRFTDIPPMYIMITVLIASYSLAVANLGAVSVISLASRAYQRFTRDVAINEISQLLSSKVSIENFSIADSIKKSLPLISKLTGAGQVSILINLPYGRPIINSYSAINNSIVTYDDGRIPGAVTLRSFVYGDECWYEPYAEFAKRIGAPHNEKFTEAEFVCVSPIRVNHNNLGVLMLTKFDDEHIRGLKKNSALEDEELTGKLLVDTLANAISDDVLLHLKSHTSKAAELLSKIRDAIPASADGKDFLQNFIQAVSSVAGMRAMLHQKVSGKGVAICQQGFSTVEWSLFENAPFNLEKTAHKPFGSTVIAFQEGKSSYLKDWHEIKDKLHPKTNEILETINARSLLAIPLCSGDDKYVVTLVSSNHEEHKDPGIMEGIEATEAIFEAALTVLKQRSSVIALGKLANRLIGCDDVREKILSAAKQDQLPTTIGSPRESFLLLFDLAGSSQLPADTEDKAKAYGLFYDEVNKSVAQFLGGKIRKTIGDAVIATWDGTGTDLNQIENVLEKLLQVVKHADDVAISVGCAGVRCILHYGEYFFGLVGTQSFGQIDVIGRGIDEVCKMEGVMKGICFKNDKAFIAYTDVAIAKLTTIETQQLTEAGYKNVLTAPNLSVNSATIAWVLTRESARSFNLDFMMSS